MNLHRILSETGKKLHDEKLVIGAGGNISLRDGDSFIIKKKGADMSFSEAANYVSVPVSGISLGKNDILSSETPLHVACYSTRADIKAVIHVHAPFSIAAASKLEVLPSTSYEFDCIIQKEVPVVDYIAPGSRELASAVAEKIAEGANVVLLKKHGSLSVGETMEEAFLRILALERACITYLHSR